MRSNTEPPSHAATLPNSSSKAPFTTSETPVGLEPTSNHLSTVNPNTSITCPSIVHIHHSYSSLPIAVVPSLPILCTRLAPSLIRYHHPPTIKPESMTNVTTPLVEKSFMNTSSTTLFTTSGNRVVPDIPCKPVILANAPESKNTSTTHLTLVSTTSKESSITSTLSDPLDTRKYACHKTPARTSPTCMIPWRPTTPPSMTSNSSDRLIKNLSAANDCSNGTSKPVGSLSTRLKVPLQRQPTCLQQVNGRDVIPACGSTIHSVMTHQSNNSIDPQLSISIVNNEPRDTRISTLYLGPYTAGEKCLSPRVNLEGGDSQLDSKRIRLIDSLLPAPPSLNTRPQHRSVGAAPPPGARSSRLLWSANSPSASTPLAPPSVSYLSTSCTQVIPSVSSLSTSSTHPAQELPSVNDMSTSSTPSAQGLFSVSCMSTATKVIPIPYPHLCSESSPISIIHSASPCLGNTSRDNSLWSTSDDENAGEMTSPHHILPLSSSSSSIMLSSSPAQATNQSLLSPTLAPTLTSSSTHSISPPSTITRLLHASPSSLPSPPFRRTLPSPPPPRPSPPLLTTLPSPPPRRLSPPLLTTLPSPLPTRPTHLHLKHMCHTCDRRFSQKAILRRHYQTHVNKGYLACKHCNETFVNKVF